MKKNEALKDRQHQEHREWLSKLDFYREQIAIFQNGLQQVVQQNPELLSIIEHVDEYRSILLRKKIHLEEFCQRIQEHEQLLVSGDPDASSDADAGHAAMAEELAAFFKELESLKPAFRRFVAYND